MIFEANGKDASTGEIKKIAIEAISRREAKKIAGRKGLIAVRLKRRKDVEKQVGPSKNISLGDTPVEFSWGCLLRAALLIGAILLAMIAGSIGNELGADLF